MKNADSPAMPITDKFGMPYNTIPDEVCTIGITKREYLAAKAMQGIMANPNAQPTTNDHFTYIAQDAIKIADTLLSELEKEPKQ